MANAPPLPGTIQGDFDEIKIIMMLCLPEIAQTVQYAGQFSIDKTAVNKIIQREEMSYQDQPEEGQSNLVPTETFAAGFRGRGSMWARLRVHDPNKPSATSKLVLADSETLTTDIANIGIFPEPSGQMNFNCAVPEVNVVYKPQGDFMVAGRNFKVSPVGKSWIYIDGTPDVDPISKFTFAFKTQAQLVNGCRFRFTRWNGGAPTETGCPTPVFFRQNDVAFAGKSSTAITICDFYTVDYAELVTPADPAIDADYKSVADPLNGIFLAPKPGVHATFESSSSQLRQVKVEQAFENINQLGPGFMLAGSERYTDISPPLNMDGMATMANTRTPMQWWQWYSAAGGKNSIFNAIANYKDAYAGPMRLGSAWQRKESHQKGGTHEISSRIVSVEGIRCLVRR